VHAIFAPHRKCPTSLAFVIDVTVSLRQLGAHSALGGKTNDNLSLVEWDGDPAGRESLRRFRPWDRPSVTRSYVYGQADGSQSFA